MFSMRSQLLRQLAPALVLAAVILANAQPLTPAQQPQPGSDAAIYALIDSVRQKAAQIQIDGKGEDWEGIPAFTDPAGDVLEGDASRDIVKAATAPRENDLLVMAATTGKPSQDLRTFWLRVDFLGRRQPDIEIGLGQQGQNILWIYEENKPARSISPFSGVEVAIGDVVEAKVSYTALAQVLPPAMTEWLTGAKARSWIRLNTVYTQKRDTQKVFDWGPSVASFRLIPTPYPLDPPLPRPGTPPLAIELPFNSDNKWWIGQGPFTTGTHEGTWAYDFWIADNELSPSRNVRDSTRNEDYYAWEQPVLAPLVGRVLPNLRNDQPDNPIAGQIPPNARDNHVQLDIGSNITLVLVHFRQGSITVAAGQQVEAGKVIGLVGNSGQSGLPHLHLEFRLGGCGASCPDKGTLPLALANVRVSLNPEADDLWTRELTYWEASGGFFVERMKPASSK